MDRIHVLAARLTTSCVASGTLSTRLIGKYPWLTYSSEAKKSHSRNHPKGYAEMLERQQNQLVAGLQTLYSQLQNAALWDGPPLSTNGKEPLTHDILASLNLLQPKEDGTGQMKSFEDIPRNERHDSGYASHVSDLTSPSHVPGKLEGSSSIAPDIPTSPHEELASPIASPLGGLSASLSTKSQQQSFSDEQQQPQPYSQQRHARPLLAKPILLHEPPLNPVSKVLPPLDTISYQQPSSQIPPLFEDPQLYSPDWPQLVTDSDGHDETGLIRQTTAPLFTQPFDVVQDTPGLQKHSPNASRRPLWQRRLGLDSTDFMSDFANLSPLDISIADFKNVINSQNVEA